MPKRFLTERDINEYAAQGVQELVLEPGTVVTDLGQERARAAGMKLVQVRTGAHPAVMPPQPAPVAAVDDVQAQVRTAVIAQLGCSPDGLDAIITRVCGEFKIS